MPSPLEGGSRTLQAAHQGSKWWLEGLCLGHIWVAYIYIIYIITTIFKFKSKLLINGFKCLALVLIRFGIISRVSRRGIVGEGSNMFFGRGWYPFDIPHRMDTYLSQNDSAPMEWLKNKGSMTWFWMICACPLSPLNLIGSTYPCHFDGQVRSRHALRCPKAIHGSAALCSGLQGDVSDMILVVKLLRYIIICPSLRQKINHNIIWLTINRYASS